MNYTANKVYKNKGVARDYDKNRFYSLRGRLVDWREKDLISKAIRLSGIKPHSKILDMPTGTARLSIFLAEKGYQLVGVDISSAMIEQGRIKLKDSPLEKLVKFEVSNGESLPFSDSSFEVAVSLRLFGHLPPENRLNVLKELSRVSRSFVIVAYYHRISLQGFMRRKWRVQKEIMWFPVDSVQIDMELKKAGLKRIRRSFLLPGVSETVVILAEKLKG